MATDGVKIIDGDSAHDMYWGIMDLYDAGATMETIKKRFPFPCEYVDDDFTYEIDTTAHALAMWEIGEITDEILQEVKRVIEKGACVSEWTEEYDEKLGKRRQKVLNKFWNKITSTNQKIRKRKKYKTVANFLFEINDVLTFRLDDENYYAIILLDIYQNRGKCSYCFGKIVYKSKEIPTINNLINCNIIGHKILSGIHKDGFVLGMDMTCIDHKDLVNITNKFQKIGKICLEDEFRKMGGMSGAATFEDLTYHFEDLENYAKVFRMKMFPIKDFI